MGLKIKELRRFIAYLFAAIVVMTVGFFGVQTIANAVEFSTEPAVNLEFDAYVCPAGWDPWDCFFGIDAGDLDTYHIDSGSTIEPGSRVLFIEYIKLNGNETVAGINNTVKFDNSLWTVVSDDEGTEVSGTLDDTDLPYTKKGSKITPNWTIEFNISQSQGYVKFIGETDAGNEITSLFEKFDGKARLGAFMLELNSDATPGTTMNFTYSQDPGDIDVCDTDAKQIHVNSGSYSFSVYGDKSRDYSLKSLTVTGDGRNYILDPTFDPDQTEYTVYVPAGTSSVSITPTPNNQYASIVDGSQTGIQLLTKDGNNDFEFEVVNQYGDKQKYTIHVYRLSSDISLSSLTLTNANISVAPASGDPYTYNTVTPITYATKNSVLAATATHANATITGDLGAWTFTESGATLNTRHITVHAENCMAIYSTVPGNETGCTEQEYTINVERIAPSTNKYLTSLIVTGSDGNVLTLNPGFNKAIENYTIADVNTNITGLTVAATVEDTGKANVKSGNGYHALVIDDNIINIVVQAEDLSEKTYKIEVRRLSNDISLSLLKVTSSPLGSMTPTFTSSFKGTYTYTYQPTVTSIDVQATVNDTGKAKVYLYDASETKTNDQIKAAAVANTLTNTFTTSTETVNVAVVAENGDIQIYPVNLNRQKSNNNYLSDLKVKDSNGTYYSLSPTFTAVTRRYNVTVPAEVTSLDVEYTKADTRSTITGITGDTGFAFGNGNTIEIAIESESGTSASYYITVTRDTYKIATLDALTVDGSLVSGSTTPGGSKITFDKDTLEYYLDDVLYTKSSVLLDGSTTNSYATVTGLGNKGLTTGDNTLEVKVTAQDTSISKTYKLHIYREKNDDNTVHGISVSGKVPVDNGDNTYSVTLPNSKTTLNPSDVVVSISSDASIIKDAALPLVTTGVNTYTFSVTSEKGDTEVYTIYVTREKSTDTTISRVNLTIGADSSRYCVFAAGETSCNIDVPVSTTAFSLEAIIPSVATVNPVNGTEYTMGASESTKSIDLEVTAEDATTKATYTVNVVRAKSSNANLSDLTVDGATVQNFRPATQIYRVTVPGTTDEVTVGAVVEDTGKANITTDLSNPFLLDFGENQIDVVVEAENNTSKTYSIIVTRSRKVDATLSSLTVNSVSVTNFNPATTEYYLTDVLYNVTTLDVAAIATDNVDCDDCAQVAINDDAASFESTNGTVNLATGDNTIKITVTAHNTSVVNYYYIYVTREKNDDTGIKGIKIKNGSTDIVAVYNSATGNYDVTVPNALDEVNSTNVEVEVNDPYLPTDPKATYTLPTTSLSTQTDNIIPITVQAEDGSTQVYNLNVERTKSAENEIKRVTLTIGDDSSRYCVMDPGVTTCTIDVPVTTTAFTLSAQISDNATISPVNGTEYTMSSTESTKDITLTVSAEDGTPNTYTVTINRARSSNADLSDLKVAGETVQNFTVGQQIYNVSVPGTTDEVLISATVFDVGRANIITDLSSPYSLDFGRNQIDIEVEAENGTKKTFTVFVTREFKTDPTLQDITISGTTINGFHANTYVYSLTPVNYNTVSLYVGAVATDNVDCDDCAMVSINGDPASYASSTSVVPLNTGDNDITITVTAHDGTTTQDYVIKVNRAKNSDSGIKGIRLAGQTAVLRTGKTYEVTVPYNVDEATTSNLIVDVNDPKTSYDAKATYTFADTPLLTTGTVTIPITVTAEDGDATVYNLVVTRMKNTDASLSGITVTDGSFNPSFRSNVYEYTVTIPVTATEFDVDATLTDPNASIISGTGHYTMGSDSSSMDVEVTTVSEDTSANLTYTLHITRTQSSVNTLDSITVSKTGDNTTVYALSPDFDPETTTYTINVPGDVDSVDIDAQLTDNRATIVNGVGTKTLNVGSNPVTIRVKSESGSYIDYTLTINRARKTNANLATLVVTSDDGSVLGLTPTFDPDSETIEYVVDDVDYDVTSVIISATVQDADATVTGTGFKGLTTGENSFEVKVTAQDTSVVKTYTIKVTRAKNTNAYLSILSVSGQSLTPAFDKDTTSYTITVPATKEKLTPSEVTAIAADRNATVTKDEEITLSTTVDNYYTVHVVAENGIDEMTYTIKVVRPLSSDATLASVNLTNATITPTFRPETTTYTLTVPYDVTSFTIEGIPRVESTTVLSGNGEYPTSTTQVQIVTQAENGRTGLYTFNIVIAQSTDATLASLSVQGYPLDKTFVPTTLIYDIGDITYGTTQLRILADPTNASATIKYFVDGNEQESNVVNLPQTLGTKSISVEVTAADGVTKRTYSITYNMVNSANAYLSNIVPLEGNLDQSFNKTSYLYYIYVDNSVTSESLIITTENSNSSITINGGASTFTPYTHVVSDLVEGNNNVEIKVTAQDNSTSKTYNVIIVRAAQAASADANLSSLSVTDYTMTPNFDMDTTEYSLGEIPFGVTSLEINATANTGSATIYYLVNGTRQPSNVVSIPKANGNGTVTVQVVAENGTTTKNYVIRYSKNASTNAYLSSIVTSDGDLTPTFNKTTFNYEVNVDPSVTIMNITATLEDSTSTMNINGADYDSPHTYTISSLPNGRSTVTIVTTSESGAVLTYTVVIIKAAGEGEEFITSDVYGHTIEDGLIKSGEIGKTVQDMKDQLDNDNSKLEIWDAAEANQLSDSDTIATGQIVILKKDGVELDRKVIVVLGDVNGDGIINVMDASTSLNHFLGRVTLVDCYATAADVNKDGIINVMDASTMLNHFLGRTTISW